MDDFDPKFHNFNFETFVKKYDFSYFFDNMKNSNDIKYYYQEKIFDILTPYMYLPSDIPMNKTCLNQNLNKFNTPPSCKGKY